MSIIIFGVGKLERASEVIYLIAGNRTQYVHGWLSDSKLWLNRQVNHFASRLRIITFYAISSHRSTKNLHGFHIPAPHISLKFYFGTSLLLNNPNLLEGFFELLQYPTNLLYLIQYNHILSPNLLQLG